MGRSGWTPKAWGGTDNGFGLLFNWNRLGDSQHTVRAYADDVEFCPQYVQCDDAGRGGRTGAAQDPCHYGLPDGRADDDGGVAAGAAELCHYRGGMTFSPPCASWEGGRPSGGEPLIKKGGPLSPPLPLQKSYPDSASPAFFPGRKSAMKRDHRRRYANLTLSFTQLFPGISRQR